MIETEKRNTANDNNNNNSNEMRERSKTPEKKVLNTIAHHPC